jgi:multicomponent Na+:H+ antiporter subunit G
MEPYYETASAILVYIGVAFMVIASVGLLKMPDFYIRMSAITKAASLGLGFIVLGVGVYFHTAIILVKVLAIIFFVFLTSPVSAHVIARAALRDKVPFWKKTALDDFKPYLRQHGVLQETEGEEKELKKKK